MNAFCQDIVLTEVSGIPASRSTLMGSRSHDVAARLTARIALFQDCLENALTGLVLLGCLLFAAAALRLGIAPCPIRHWGVLSIYAFAVTLAAGTLLAVAKDMLHFKKSFG